MNTPDVVVSEITGEEIAAGFSVREEHRPDGHLPGTLATVASVMHTWGDASHRLVKMRWRDGRTVFQLQAFGRPRSRVSPPGWYPERHWPDRYGPAWVVDRLREYVGRPDYQALIELCLPAGDAH